MVRKQLKIIMKMSLRNRLIFLWIFLLICVIISSHKEGITMNLLELIEKDLNNKDWDLYTKARYLYLKSCELFSYDYRCHYADRNFIEKLLAKEFNLENINDNRVLCGSWSSQIYLELLKIIGIEGTLHCNYGSHQYVKFNIDDQEIIADACVCNDLARVKFGNNTLGFYPCRKRYDHRKIEDLDRKIGYLSDDYTGVKLEKQATTLESEYKEYINSRVVDENDLLIYKLYRIKEIFDELPSIKNFADSEHIITYMISKLLTENEQRKIKKLELYNPYVKGRDFMRIYNIDLPDNSFYFSLSNEGNGYNFYKTTESDVLSKKLFHRNNYIK